MGGWGGYDRPTDAALQAFVEAIRARPTGTRRLYFDLSGVVLPQSARAAATPAEERDLQTLRDLQREFPQWRSQLVLRIRQLGIERVLFATDIPVITPADYQALLREQLGLTKVELERLFANIAVH